MYRPESHTLLIEIIKDLEERQSGLPMEDARHFGVRLAENFDTIYQGFLQLYGEKYSVSELMLNLSRALLEINTQRPADLRKIDVEREEDPRWLHSNQWVGTMLYTDLFAKDLGGFKEHLPYLRELGINLVHLMPLLKSPKDENDGGYAVSDYRKVDPRLGSMKDIREIAAEFRKNNMLLTLDFVMNHTADDHQWARKARAGEKEYQDYYYMFDNRVVPDLFERTLPEVFPTSAPGNFTYLKKIKKWVMTVFHDYQWDLNYNNPAVFIEMFRNTAFLANQGADIIRLDAVPFIWKKLGTDSQNEPEAHLILQIFKACMQVAAPGVALIAEAIVTPEDIIRYMGDEDHAECDVAYNATFMALTWEALATQKTNLLNRVISNLPPRPRRSTWINYLRSHDDIGLGFHDHDIYESGYNAPMHREFLVNYYSGRFEGSMASGAPFMFNPATNDARISGNTASLCGLETSLKRKDKDQIQKALDKILMLHGIILTLGGLPMIFSGDEIGLTNDYSYLEDPRKAYDNRWMHRPRMNWKKAANRKEKGTVEEMIFNGLRKLISLRKKHAIFSDRNDMRIEYCENVHILAYSRTSDSERVLVMCNMADDPQVVSTSLLARFNIPPGDAKDMVTGRKVKIKKGFLEFKPYAYYWFRSQV